MVVGIAISLVGSDVGISVVGPSVVGPRVGASVVGAHVGSLVVGTDVSPSVVGEYVGLDDGQIVEGEFDGDAVGAPVPIRGFEVVGHMEGSFVVGLLDG